jgi:hypothetical protein
MTPSFEQREIGMHAVFVTASIDPASAEESENQLRSEVVPRVKQAPGFVAGYWTRSGSQGSSCIVFDNEGAAQQAVEMIKNQPTPKGVTIESAEAREIIASA